jgi:putative DNA primase/helicase
MTIADVKAVKPRRVLPEEQPAQSEASDSRFSAALRAPRSGPAAPLVRKLDYVFAEDLDDKDQAFDDELIEGVIGRNAMSVLYGDSNSGKTFLAIDIGAAVARGKQWLGRNTSHGVVVYLATEAAASVRMRLQAYQRHHRTRVRGFVIVQSPVNLFEGDEDVTALLALITEVESMLGEKAVLIIGDTLARISAGANENSGEDMGVVLRKADAIRNATGAAFLWIHHCGKDQAKGMRGWSGMRAAIDTEIEVTADESTGLRGAEITKQRDLPGKGDRIGFRLEAVVLGANAWGTPRTSCVVAPAEAPPKAARGKRLSEIAGAIAEALSSRGTGMRKGELVRHLGRYDKSAVYREMRRMVDAGRLHEVAGVIALVEATT